MNQDLPHLRHWTIPDRPIAPPRKRIYTEEHVKLWTTTQGFADYSLFYRRLNEAVVGHDLPKSDAPAKSQAINSTLHLLEQLEQWVDEIPPQELPQRFGNLAFRDWGKRLEERTNELLKTMLPDTLHSAVPLLSPYLLQSFGSFSRIDYGSGHELSFALFLCALTLIRFYRPTPNEERDIVLVIFAKYIQVVWKLQDVYKLEPAGSHGVWGLDDYQFLSYLWGSAQLRDHSVSRPPSVLNVPLAETNLYYQSINRIHKLKTGPFHEHSPQLHSIATSVATWWKVNQGMIRMYEAEVLSKRVVVQHLPLGAIIEWDPDDVEEEVESPVSPPWTTTALPPSPLPSGASPIPIPTDTPIQTYQSLVPPGSSHPGTSPRAGTSPMRRPTGGRLATLISAPEAKRNSGTPLPPLLSTLTDEPEEMDGPLDSFRPPGLDYGFPTAAQGSSQTPDKAEGQNKIEAQPLLKEPTPPLTETPKVEKDQPVETSAAVEVNSNAATSTEATKPDQPAKPSETTEGSSHAIAEATKQGQPAKANEAVEANRSVVAAVTPPETTNQPATASETIGAGGHTTTGSETIKDQPVEAKPIAEPNHHVAATTGSEGTKQDKPAEVSFTVEASPHATAATGSEGTKENKPAEASANVEANPHAAAATGSETTNRSETTNQKTSPSGSNKSSKDDPTRVSRRSRFKTKANDVLRRISRIIKS